jgi:hypothetical protein
MFYEFQTIACFHKSGVLQACQISISAALKEKQIELQPTKSLN